LLFWRKEAGDILLLHGFVYARSVYYHADFFPPYTFLVYELQKGALTCG